MCTLMTLITTTFLHLAVHNYTCSFLTIAQPISTIATCILLTYMLPKEIETLTCNKSWLKHCISRYKTAVSGRATLCKHDNRWLSILASLQVSVCSYSLLWKAAIGTIHWRISLSGGTRDKAWSAGLSRADRDGWQLWGLFHHTA